MLLIRLQDVLERLAEWNLRVNGAKTILGVTEWLRVRLGVH
jgi:hypothetical protein